MSEASTKLVTQCDQQTLSVFVVDDDPDIRESVIVALRPLKIQVECFASAEDFLNQWDGPKPGCLLLDVRMSGMSGIELYQQLLPEHSYLSIVIVTAHATVSMSVDALKKGAYDFLEKPYAPDKLRTVVTQSIKISCEKWRELKRREAYQQLRSALSPRELEVYQLLLGGLENKQIATELGISASTVEKHRLAVIRKMQIDNPVQLLNQKISASGTNELD